MKSWVVLSMLPRCEVESREGGGKLKEEEASLSHFVRVELIPAMQDSGIVVPTAPSGQPIMPGVIYADDREFALNPAWSSRFDHVLVKAYDVFKEMRPDLVMVLLDKDRNCKYTCLSFSKIYAYFIISLSWILTFLFINHHIMQLQSILRSRNSAW